LNILTIICAKGFKSWRLTATRSSKNSFTWYCMWKLC
jgi:hypothetical protein